MRLEKESGGKQAGDENPEKKLKDEGDHDDGAQAKKLKDEGGGPQAQMPCNVIRFCQTRNWIFDLDRKSWNAPTATRIGKLDFRWKL